MPATRNTCIFPAIDGQELPFTIVNADPETLRGGSTVVGSRVWFEFQIEITKTSFTLPIKENSLMLNSLNW